MKKQNISLLIESQESKSISAAKKLVMQKFGWNEQRADEFIRKQLRQDLPALRTRNGGKFILGVTRMFCDNQLINGGTIMQLNRTLELVASDAHVNEYDRNLNGMSAEELINRFAGNIKELGDKDREEVAALELQENNDYTIVRIDDFQQSSQYGKYTSWCVTHDSRMLDSYTSDGVGQFYFCLKNGFENVPEKRGKGCPLDEYGLSMVAVSVDEDGKLNTCTCRWNHDYGGDDHVMDTKQISKLIGRNFYEVFKPNGKWKTALETAMQRLENGDHPSDIFGQVIDLYNNNYLLDMKGIYLSGKYNFLKKNKIIYPNLWFNDIDRYFSNGFGMISHNNKLNFINTEGKIISPNLWFDDASYFNYGLACFRVNRKWNFMNTEGKIISPNLWFDKCMSFSEGFSRVYLNNEWNFIDTEGRILSPDLWFDNVHSFFGGFADVCKNEKWNQINTEGKLTSPDLWSNSGFDFHDDCSIISIDDENLITKYNYIDKNGKLISPDLWFDKTRSFTEGLGSVYIEELGFNYIDKSGRILSPDLWFYYATLFANGYGRVETEKGWNFINHNGEFLSPNKWFDEIRPFNCDFAAIRIDNKWNFINQNGEIISPNLWFDRVYSFNIDVATIYVKNYGWNFLKRNGKLLSPNKWFEMVCDFEGKDYTSVFINYEEKILDKDGNIYNKFEDYSNYLVSKLSPKTNEVKQRKNIIITEAQAFDLLLEAASLADVYQKYYSKIPEEEFKKIVAADPTSGEDKMGKYSKWLLALYTGGNLKLEDLYKATRYLTTFHKYKAKLERKDIGQYKSLPDLYNAIQPYEDNTQAASHKEEIRQIKDGAKKVYEDDEWLIIVPETKKAAIEYGKGTQWCTAATESDNYFDYYNDKGTLYININKRTGAKYQFHFETQQFMDEKDNFIDTPVSQTIGLSKGAIGYYYDVMGNDVIFINFPDENIWKVENSKDLYITGDGVAVQQMVNGEPHELVYTTKLGLEPKLIWNRFIIGGSDYGYRFKIKNFFDVKEKKFVFNDNLKIQKIIKVNEKERYYLVDYQDVYHETKVYDLLSDEFLDCSSNIGRGYLTTISRIGCRCYPENFMLEVSLSYDEPAKGSYKIVDLEKDKCLTDKYNYYTFITEDFNSRLFKFILLSNDKLKITENASVPPDAIIIFYDGTVMNYKEDFIRNKNKIFERYLSEKNLTLDELAKSALGN